MVWARMVFVMALALGLSGCWLSTADLFGPEDWAKVELAGSYTIDEIAESRKASLETSSDARVSMTYFDPDGPQDVLLFFVAIPEAPEGWYLMGQKDTDASGRDFAFYTVAQLTHDSKVLSYQARCEATSSRKGMLRRKDTLDASSCVFMSKEAIMSAALEVVEFVSKPQIVDISPSTILTQVENGAKAGAADGAAE